MLPRTLEPELMDTPEEAVDYDAMDHSEVNRLFAEQFLAVLDRGSSVSTAGTSIRVLDVGTGTAQIPLEICRGRHGLTITAIDAAANMLQLAQRNVIRAGMEGRIRLDHVDAKGLPYTDGEFDAVISNSIVHHIPQPIAVLREMARVLKLGGILFVRDLLRPADSGTVDRIVNQYAQGANEHQRLMFRNSLHAALTIDELKSLLREIGLPAEWAAQTSDRHWTICGLMRETD